MFMLYPIMEEHQYIPTILTPTIFLNFIQK
jgi:hypothetical protein